MDQHGGLTKKNFKALIHFLQENHIQNLLTKIFFAMFSVCVCVTVEKCQEHYDKSL